MDLALKDRRVLITGGSQGVGNAIARGFLAEGARVVIVSRDQDRLQKALVELAALGPVEGKAVDFSQRCAPEAIAVAFRDVDVLVNNAARSRPATFSAWMRRAGGRHGISKCSATSI